MSTYQSLNASFGEAANGTGKNSGILSGGLEIPGGSMSYEAPSGGFYDEIHQYRQAQFSPSASGTERLVRTAYTGSASSGNEDLTELAMGTGGGGGSGGSSALGNFMSYIGDITYVGLAASAFNADDPMHLQDRAMRFFEEHVRHKHARDNPQAWVLMADAVMTQEHLTSQGAKMKPLNLGTLNGESKNEAKLDAQHKDIDGHQAANAKKVIDTTGLKTEDDYVLASTYLYLEAIEKADQRATQEAKDHKVEKRALGRMKWTSGETDLTDAVQSSHNSIDPILLELGSQVSYRLEAAHFLERYGNKSSQIDYTGLIKKLREDAQTIFNDPDKLSDPVRRVLLNQYGSELKNQAQN